MTKKLELWIKGWGLNEEGYKQYRLLNEGLINHEKFWLEMEKIEREMEKIEREMEKIERQQGKLNRKLFWNIIFRCVWFFIGVFLAGFLLGLWAKFNI